MDEGMASARGAGHDATNAGADHALRALYRAHYVSLVRLAVLLVSDKTAAEEVVQASFAAMHSAWPRLADGERALSYLRKSVVRRSRSVRPRCVVAGHAGLPGRKLQAIEPEHRLLVAALQGLPVRQREALVLRYYAGLLDGQIASAMGISENTVENYISQAVPLLLAAIRRTNNRHRGAVGCQTEK